METFRRQAQLYKYKPVKIHYPTHLTKLIANNRDDESVLPEQPNLNKTQKLTNRGMVDVCERGQFRKEKSFHGM